ncbi:DNA polymerase epsilon, subunit B [Coniophora puteana RWD-64-598 SS2]|uniref:DNA polymerase epsilon subunit n=1 Tax=Coniophora puteana (strain RWD-64-598) TaxID=741705 RepID=A0A5M3MSN7_CONPW|nr:DNA polymerase epsilon, subunit B [Coniophora puteana RWD-64-598 SS2]EIW82110.1 DNA polymerase epsilon, subunit B [Coniophora puteana RWD-64-598 SS2]
MADSRQRTIIQVFRKYSHSLGPEALQFIENVLHQHDISEGNVEYSVEMFAKEYNKQDDAAMKVSLSILKRVYDTLQDQGADADALDAELLDPESHLHIIDAFEMPLWNWSQERGTFEKFSGPLTIAGSADTRVMATRNRLHIIKQSVLRNEHFSPSTLPSRDRERLVTLKSTKQLLGRAGDRFLLLGLLVHNKEGKLCIEDSDGSVELDLSKLGEPGEGLYTEGCLALVEGEYTDENTLEVVAIGQPPCEDRETARSIYGHIDFLGKGSTSLLEDSNFTRRIREDLSDLYFFFLSDVWLDDPRTFVGLQKMFDNCVANSFIPKVIALCGNFTSRSLAQGNARDIQRYQENFDTLADLIASYPQVTRTTHFIFVPGPLDITSSGTLPRRPLLSTFTSQLKSKIPRVHFATNPCRIKFFGQEIVIFRENTMARMLRNTVGVKPHVTGEELRRYSILDQSHLVPLTSSILPTLPDYDHSLRLYPLPTVVILADKYEKYKLTYSGCHVFNPGSFVGKDFSFSTYCPAELASEEG